ncbi:hypothetical protein ACSNN7_06960 [Micromonospora sp. URMC 105]|uniref:hypothetical protein n=1 Tax=Micromonospora sp. URMC 105 TaxID=3423413 RepID=UPI003F1C3E1B
MAALQALDGQRLPEDGARLGRLGEKVTGRHFSGLFHDQPGVGNRASPTRWSGSHCRNGPVT